LTSEIERATLSDVLRRGGEGSRDDDSGTFDPTRRYVRVIDERPDGFVEFGFAIGEPDLEVELLMSAAAFDDFCRHNDVTMLASDARATPWGLNDARHWTPDTPVPDPADA
jgi:phenol hydroxylase P0 protein